MLTASSIPSKTNVPVPILPAAHVGPFTSAPLFPFPLESAAVVPPPSSKVQWPTRPSVGAARAGRERASRRSNMARPLPYFMAK